MAIVEERAVEIKDLVVLEKAPEILPDDPTEILEEVVIEIQETDQVIDKEG